VEEDFPPHGAGHCATGDYQDASSEKGSGRWKAGHAKGIYQRLKDSCAFAELSAPQMAATRIL
jgi:hypothetical protein